MRTRNPLHHRHPTPPALAVIGRSNVGKSSLINLVTGRSSLALVSKTPGEGVQCCFAFMFLGCVCKTLGDVGARPWVMWVQDPG